jgi:hypothetical protein
VTALDVADLVVIGGRVLGIGTDAALGRCDIAAAQAALAEARSAGHQPAAAFPDRGAASVAGIGLVHALLRHRPFPDRGAQVAVAAGLQFLSLNGWQAGLDPPAAAAVVVEALASGRLTQADAAAWLLPRLSPSPAFGTGRARMRMPRPGLRSLRTVPVTAMLSGGRMLVSAMLTIALAGLALLATACSRGLDPPAAHPGGQPPAARQSSRPESARAAELAYTACMRSRGIGNFPGPSASGVIVITPSAGIKASSPALRSAEHACQQDVPVPPTDIVVAGAARRG